MRLADAGDALVFVDAELVRDFEQVIVAKIKEARDVAWPLFSSTV